MPKIFSGDDYVREAQVTKRHSTTTRVEEGTTDNLIQVFFLLLLTSNTYLPTMIILDLLDNFFIKIIMKLNCNV